MNPDKELQIMKCYVNEFCDCCSKEIRQCDCPDHQDTISDLKEEVDRMSEVKK